MEQFPKNCNHCKLLNYNNKKIALHSTFTFKLDEHLRKNTLLMNSFSKNKQTKISKQLFKPRDCSRENR